MSRSRTPTDPAPGTAVRRAHHGLVELPRNPLGRRMGGNCQPEQLPTGVLKVSAIHTSLKNESVVPRTGRSRQCRHDCKGRSSSLAQGWPPPLGHVFCHRGLPDLDAELEQLAMDARCAPEGIGDAHLANELANIGCGPRSSTSGSRFPAPIGRKPARCQRITVSGLTIFRASRTLGASA